MKYMCHISLNIRIAYAHIVNSYEAIYETYMLLVCKTHATYKASYMSRTCKHTFNIYDALYVAWVLHTSSIHVSYIASY